MIDFIASSGTFYRGMERWDFMLGNPNKAAAVAAILVVVLLAAAIRQRGKVAAAACAALSAVAALALAFTFSRGGAVALAAGAAVFLFFERRRISAAGRWRHVFAVFAVFAAVAAATGFAARIVNSSPQTDASVGNRLAIWKCAAKMMADAPGGWGRGNAGAAYMGWYQEIDSACVYRTLVSSPLTYLVEAGSCWRWTAVALSVLLAAALVFHLRRRSDPLPLAVWTVFAVASCFSTVAECWVLRAIALLALLPLVLTVKLALLSRTGTIGAVLAAAGTATAAVWLLVPLAASLCGGGIEIRRDSANGRITAGSGEPAVWAVYGDGGAESVCACGKAVRIWLGGKRGSIGIAERLEQVPASARKIALYGRAASRAALRELSAKPEDRSLAVFAPENPQLWLDASNLNVRVYCGEFSAKCPDRPHARLAVVDGCEDHISFWPRLLFD